MKNRLLEQANQQAKNLATFAAFAAKYGEQVEEAEFGMSVNADSILIALYTSDGEREKKLAIVAKTFGVEGWTRKPTYKNTGFDWECSIDGVRILLNNVEVLPKLVASPVTPKEWPLCIEA